MKFVGEFVNQRAWPIIQKDLLWTWRQFSIHLFSLLGPDGSRNSEKYYWSISPPWAGQGDHWLGESGIGSWLWFYLGPSNRCRFVRSCIYSSQERLGFHTAVRLVGLAPFGSLPLFDTWSTRFLIELDDILAHWVVVCHGSDQFNAWSNSVEVPRWVRRICPSILPRPYSLASSAWKYQL